MVQTAPAHYNELHMNPKMRLLLLPVVALAVASLVAWVGYGISRNQQVTAEKVRQFADSANLERLSGAARTDALHKMEDLINSLSVEERRKWRLEGASHQWFDDLTEAEKGGFIEATLPTGFRQWLNTFDELPGDKRRQFMDDLLTRLKETHQLVTDREPGQTNGMYGTNGTPVLSPELERKARTIGLKTFYTESSAETKAELAPFLEELQQQMEHGKLLQ